MASVKSAIASWKSSGLRAPRPGTIGLGVLGIEPNGVREVVNCLGVVALDGKHDATAAVQVGLFRLQADGFRVTGNGAIALAFLVIEAGVLLGGLPCRWAGGGSPAPRSAIALSRSPVRGTGLWRAPYRFQPVSALMRLPLAFGRSRINFT